MREVRIALVGDYNEQVPGHVAIPDALGRAAEATQVSVSPAWISTTTINNAARDLALFDAVWLVPASPYAKMAGALAAVKFARENRLPFLGTCGGFQHALIEIARTLCQTDNADHAESNPTADARDLVITPLACSLVNTTGEITFTPGSLLARSFGTERTLEEYRCRYGLAPGWRQRLEAAGLAFTGFDALGEVRACELPNHPFFVGALFQPERSAFHDVTHPLVTAFVRAADTHRQRGP